MRPEIAALKASDHSFKFYEWQNKNVKEPVMFCSRRMLAQNDQHIISKTVTYNLSLWSNVE